MQQLDMTNNMNSENDLEGSVIVKAEPKTKKPPMYKVLLLNDDFTPMEFVVHVLEKYFKIGREAAIGIMLDVHQSKQRLISQLPAQLLRINYFTIYYLILIIQKLLAMVLFQKDQQIAYLMMNSLVESLITTLTTQLTLNILFSMTTLQSSLIHQNMMC